MWFCARTVQRTGKPQPWNVRDQHLDAIDATRISAPKLGGDPVGVGTAGAPLRQVGEPHVERRVQVGVFDEVGR